MNTKAQNLLSPRYKYDRKIPFFFSRKRKNMIREFEDKINLSQKSESKCYLCENNDFLQISEKDKYGFYYPVVICKKCSLVQTNPYYSYDEVSLFYGDYFREIYMGTGSTQKYIYKNNIQRGEGIIKYLEKHSGEKISNKNILDIGCGNGGILQAFNNANNSCVGIDLGSTYFNEGLQSGLDLRQMPLKEFINDTQNKTYDVIIFSHNLEHLINPGEELELLKNIINENTLIYISVPGLFYMNNYNYDYLGEYFQNAHKSHFSLKSLENLLRKYGFALYSGNEEIQSIFKLSFSDKLFDFDGYKNVLEKMRMNELHFEQNKYKIYFLKYTYMLLDKLGVRIFLLKFIQRIGLTRALRKIILNER